MKYSIVIPSYNHLQDLLVPCLQSIIKYTDLNDAEIIVVLNGCTDGSKEYLERWREGQPIKILNFEEGLGYTKATNEGIKVAKGEVVILLNNDTVLLEQPKNLWIDLLLNPLKGKVGITCPLKLYSPSAERNFAVFFCCAIRKDIIDKIGLLDEVFSPGYGEDTDYSIKVEQLGYEVLQVPGDVYHNGTVMSGAFPIYHIGEGSFGVDEKWEVIKRRNEKVLHDRYALPTGWFTQHDINEYRKLINDVPDGGSICELGCYKGRSLCSVADIIKRKNLKVTVVDIFNGTDNEVKEESYEQEFIDNVTRFGLEPTIHNGYTHELSKNMLEGQFDLIFVDADHSYEAVKQDINDWLPMIKNGGKISGHDYYHSGVNRAVDEKFQDINVVKQSSVWSKRIGY